MTEPDALGFEQAALESVAVLARLTRELDELDALLTRTPLWEPAVELQAQAQWVRGQLERLAAAWERRLVVAIVGPSGAGKSTLLNALAGRQLSAVGLERPTTRQVVAFVPAEEDARWLEQALGEEQVRVTVVRDAPGLEHLVLLDTPDTNTVPENQALLERTLEHVDLVLAVFDAGNPQLLDNLAFLAPAVRRLPPDAIIPILNRIDRVTEAALDHELLPDLERALRSEWGLDRPKIYQISARAALEGPGSVEDERPLHGRNEFVLLRERVLQALNRAGKAAAQRGAHAERLVSLLYEEVEARLAESAARAEARRLLNELSQRSRQLLAEQVLDSLEEGVAPSLAEGLYERLARRWWGPVGWLVALWALLLRAIGWLRTATRRGAGAHHDDARTYESLVATQASLYATAWPPIGDRLVAMGFSPAVRYASQWRTHAEGLARAMLAGGDEAVERVLERLGRRLSLWPCQVLLNGPLIAFVAWVGVQSVGGVFTGRYLGGEFYQQAGIAAAVLWVGAFVILQLMASASLRGPLRRGLVSALDASAELADAGELLAQLEALDDLERMTRRRMHRQG